MKFMSRYLANISSSTYKVSQSFLLELLKPNDKAVVLDIGCSDGLFTKQVASKIQCSQMNGIEISRKHADRAHQNGVDVIMADIDRGFPFKDASFDIVVSNQVLEHVCSTDNFMKECFRILRNGGLCVLSTPNLASPHNILSLALGYQPLATAVSDELVCGNPLDPCDGQQIPSYRRQVS